MPAKGHENRPLSASELQAIIIEAARDRRETLDLSRCGIAELPDGIGDLTELRRLDLRSNRLTALPASIGNLTRLEILDLDDNEIQFVPTAIERLVNLQTLRLSGNQLTTFPTAICNLMKLEILAFGLPGRGNEIAAIPPCIGGLKRLQQLWLRHNKLASLPDSLGELTKLTLLELSDNLLTSLPPFLGKLNALIILEDNPLDPAVRSAYWAGHEQFHAYLRSLESPDKRERLYEAKLVLVGEGGVGKTTLLKALTGAEPQAHEPTTHGVSINIQALQVPHPERESTPIRLNAWDFGGQEVYRVTHQFFFSRRSIYLLVWEPRAGVQQCQVEDWLKLIRLRVGDNASVIIVSTFCRTGERIARIDKPAFLRDFGSMIYDFHEVDSLTDDPATGDKVGIAELKQMIANAGRRLEQMGMEFNRDWREARDELLKLGEARISYSRFGEICAGHGMDATSSATLATLMHDLGYIVYYSDDDRLKNDIVLQPEWLTKAIGFVLEDRVTQQMEGLLPDDRLTDVWRDHPFAKEPRYEPPLYPFFLRLMERYDVSYRLDSGDASLVAQHVPQVQPDLPWQPEDALPNQLRRIALLCVMDEAPVGLVPWMIVRTHKYAYSDENGHRRHWHKGMFLRYRNHGEALLEQRDREFHMHAQAVWPEYFMNVLRETLQNLIVENWPGLKGRYYFAVPCRGVVGGKPCSGRFEIEALRQFLAEGDKDIRCQTCRDRQDIVELLYGFEEQDLREQLRRIEATVDRGFKETGSQLANSVLALMKAIASEAKEGRRLFTIEMGDRKWWRQLSTRRGILRLWCEAEECQHPVFERGQGVYDFEITRDWVKRVAPYANFVAGVLKTLVPMVAPAVNVYFGPKTTENWGIKDYLELMKEATSEFLKDPEVKISDPSRLSQGMLTEEERSGILALHSMLRTLDPNHERLGLKRVPTYTGTYLWLCRRHYADAQPKIPDEIR